MLKTGEPLIGVNVVLRGSSESGTISDLNGNYSLSVPESSSLIFSYIGYVTQEVSVEGKSVLDVSLSEDMEALEEVVVIGYGTMKKSDLTGSLSSVKSEDLTAYAVPNPVQALQGRAPEFKLHRILALQKEILRFVSVVQIRLKEVTTSLHHLDGFPANMSSVNPDDIESLEVLKDASATAIYGFRGSNGVVLITTKSGRKGKTTVTYDGSYGYSISNQKT